ncbi:hypothetical protein FMEAI12_1040001 [Parafrankia sp. Ea1.12]|nr:hypothetical protein FMEAI12_1040001 [Parafrankia sp. Ea1.12]
MLAWPADTPLTWRQGVRFVAIDMSPSYRAAVRTGLPHATVVVDHFHVVQLANKTLNLVRRRLTRSVRGRRGRTTEWKARPRLPRCVRVRRRRTRLSILFASCTTWK